LVEVLAEPHFVGGAEPAKTRSRLSYQREHALSRAQIEVVLRLLAHVFGHERVEQRV